MSEQEREPQAPLPTLSTGISTPASVSITQCPFIQACRDQCMSHRHQCNTSQNRSQLHKYQDRFIGSFCSTVLSKWHGLSGPLFLLMAPPADCSMELRKRLKSLLQMYCLCSIYCQKFLISFFPTSKTIAGASLWENREEGKSGFSNDKELLTNTWTMLVMYDITTTAPGMKWDP